MNEGMKQAAENGDINALNQFLSESPNRILEVTLQRETALHIALKNNKLKAFKFLGEWIGRNWFTNAPLNTDPIFNWKDGEGNTVLHIAVLRNQTQVVNHLLALGFRFVDINRKNSECKTAWDISQGQTQVSQGQTQVDSVEIRLMLRSAGASSGPCISIVTRSDDNNIDEFYNLIGEEVQLLEHFDKLPLVNTPLHIAASYGNIQFAMEMMSLKPSFARKLNQNGFSPIHLALKNEHIELVYWFIKFDGGLVRVKGRECLTPLHYLVESGKHLNLLDEFLLLCPDSITDVTVRNETALHIALEYDRLEAFQFFVGWLANNSSKNAEFIGRKVLNWKDNKGNTVLHILILKNKTQAVRHLLSWCKEFVDVNHKNLEDKTAWDILQPDNREIGDVLRRAGAKSGSCLSTFNTNRYPNPKYQTPSSVSCVDYFWPKQLRRRIGKFGEERRNMLLVVAALLVTLSFQAVLTPPGGVWQDNGQCDTTEAGSSYHQVPPFNKTVGSSNYPKIIYLSQSNTTLACEHKAGMAVAFEDDFFMPFLVINTGIFSLSNSLIVVLILNVFMKVLFRSLSIILLLSYFYVVWTITDDPGLMIPLVSIAGIYFFLVQLLSWKQ